MSLFIAWIPLPKNMSNDKKLSSGKECEREMKSIFWGKKGFQFKRDDSSGCTFKIYLNVASFPLTPTRRSALKDKTVFCLVKTWLSKYWTARWAVQMMILSNTRLLIAMSSFLKMGVFGAWIVAWMTWTNSIRGCAGRNRNSETVAIIYTGVWNSQ